ncbi:winged helix-turn-helix domain-containing protein [Streptomyces sediminimaris]|uniref:winged helix-turn-helix domain-containing protein n=1 Tax=Streptomyces sediminimaris TaxID=3383721 RepID=UPI003999C349
MGGVYGSDGGGRELDRVADALRARMADGEYALNSLLPTQRELAEEFGVSRDTVQRVLRELKDEGWISSRQGSGSRVVRTQRVHSPKSSERPDRTVTLGPLISEAFEQDQVALDVFTLSSESLDTHIRVQAERIQNKLISPQRIALRILLPEESLPFPYWRTEDGLHDQELTDRFLAIMRRHTESLRDKLGELRAMNHVPAVDFEVRRIRLVPPFKLYLVNEVAALLGPYKIFKRPILLGGEQIEATDVFGRDAGLTHHVKDDDPHSQETVFVEQWRAWFDSAWDFLAVIDESLTKPVDRP